MMKRHFQHALVCLILPVLVMILLMSGCTQPESGDPAALLADGEYFVQVADLDLETMQVRVDELEWVLVDDLERIAELGLDPEMDMPNDFYIHNEAEVWLELPLAANAELAVIDWGEQIQPVEVTPAELKARLEEYPVLFNMTVADDTVIKLTEQYVP